MRIHSIVHAGHEGIGAIAQWIEFHGFTHTSTDIGNGDSFPSPGDFDMLIIMGGPMSVNDRLDWINKEKILILNSINSGKYVVGICLGAQMIASALGAKISKNEYKEIGWFPVRKSMWVSHPITNYLPLHFTTFHWHGEKFDIPEGAIRIMESEACPNQAFVYGNRTVGFQYHMEFTPEMLQIMIDKGKNELVKSVYVQTAGEIHSQLHACSENNIYLFRILDNFLCSFKKENQK
jgi:GMP synthase-like glutamine amidotransferase